MIAREFRCREIFGKVLQHRSRALQGSRAFFSDTRMGCFCYADNFRKTGKCTSRQAAKPIAAYFVPYRKKWGREFFERRLCIPARLDSGRRGFLRRRAERRNAGEVRQWGYARTADTPSACRNSDIAHRGWGKFCAFAAPEPLWLRFLH